MREMAPRARTDFMAQRFDGRDAAVKVPLAGVSGRHYVRVTLALGRLDRRVFTRFAEARKPPARLHIIWSRSEGAAGTHFETSNRISPSQRWRSFRGWLLRTGDLAELSPSLSQPAKRLP